MPNNCRESLGAQSKGIGIWGGGREWGDLRELSLKDTKQLLRKFGCLILKYGNQGWETGLLECSV